MNQPMNQHLDDAALALLARTGAGDAHLRGCAHCQARLREWQALQPAARTVAERSAAPADVPPFALIREALTPPVARSAPAQLPQVQVQVQVPPVPPVLPVPRRVPALAETARLAWAVTWRQPRLMPRSLPVLTLLGLVLAILVGRVVPDPALARHYFGSVVILVALTGSGAILSRRTDPRLELFAALTISPAVVLLARVVLVLGADILLGLAASAVLGAWGGAGNLPELVASWFGPALLAGTAALWLGVRRGAGAGAVLGILLWVAGSILTRPDAVVAARLAPVADQLWRTTPWTLLASVVLLGLALREAGRLTTEKNPALD